MTNSSHPLLSCTDGIATGMSDILLLIARVLMAAVFLMTVSTGGPNVAYLKSINFIAPEFMSPFAHIVEWIIIVTLVLGLGTRYGALLAFALRGDRLCDRTPLLAVPGGGADPAIRVPQQGSRHRRRRAGAVRGRRRPDQRRQYAGAESLSGYGARRTHTLLSWKAAPP